MGIPTAMQVAEKLAIFHGGVTAKPDGVVNKKLSTSQAEHQHPEEI